MLSQAEILKKVKLLEIRTRKLVTTLFAGQYHSSFKGQGMTFAEFREYVPGDDVRAISWPVTARTGKTFIKKFDEERELTFMLVVDISASTRFGSTELSKSEVMAHVAALFGFAAVRNNDQVGALLYSENVEHFVPPKKGVGQVQRILRDILSFQEKSSAGTRLARALGHLQQVLKKRSTILILSDFWDSNFSAELKRLARKHEVVCLMVRDPVEKELPPMGIVQVKDAESGEVVVVDWSSKSVRDSYLEHLKLQEDRTAMDLKKAQVEWVRISTVGDYLQPVIEYFRRRA